MVKFAPLLLLLLWILSPFIFLSLGANTYIVFSIFLLSYFLYKITTFSLGSFIGYFRYRKEIKIDWLQKIDIPLPKHLIAIPVFKEDFQIVLRLIDSIFAQTYPKEHFNIVISIESDYYKKSYFKIIQKRYGKLASQISIVKHQLSGDEVAGAAANRKHAVASFVESLHREADVSEYLVSSPDCDSVFHPQYFARVSYEYQKSNRSAYDFYQTGIYTFANNIKRTNPLIQMSSYGLQLSLLASAVVHPAYRHTFSCFTLPLSTLIKIDYWDSTIPIDDYPLYWRAATVLGRPLESKSFFIPISVNAIEGHSFLDSITSQVTQFYRWGLGIIAFPDAIEYLKDSKDTFLKKVKLTYFLFETTAFQTSWVLLITIHFLVIHNFEFSGSGILLPISNGIALLAFLFFLLLQLIKLLFALEIGVKHALKVFVLNVIELPISLILVILFGIYPLLKAYIDFARSKKNDITVQWASKLTKIK